MKNKIISILMFCLVVSNYAFCDDLDFSKINKDALGKLLFDEIERLDANAIYVRNKTKTVKWPEYRAAMTKKISSANSKKALAIAIDAAQQGFINSHSAIQPYSILYDVPMLYKDSPDKRGLELGFTYPEIHFFSLKTNEWVSHVNGIDLAERFEHFEQFECQFAHQNACLGKYIKRIKFGWARLGIENEVKLQSSSGKQWTETVANHKPKDVTQDNLDTDYCTHYAADYPDWELRFSGSNLCLLRKEEKTLLRIHRFGDWGVPQNDYYCYGEAKNGTLCHDVQVLSKVLSANKMNKIVIDLQDNFGGTENTPLVALLSPKEFKDNLVKFRYTPEILDDTFRTQIFYNNERASHWWDSSIDTKQLKLTKPDWLPVRADFCRGSDKCSFVAVPRRLPVIDIKKIVVVVNSGCFSSCDDFTWRLKRDANAFIVGQPPVTDGTYVSASGVIFITPQGELGSKVFGPGQPSGISPAMTKLLWYRVPYSVTLNENDSILEGDANVLDDVIPITRENFKKINSHSVSKALALLN